MRGWLLLPIMIVIKRSILDAFFHLMNIREIILILQNINTMIVMSVRRAFG